MKEPQSELNFSDPERPTRIEARGGPEGDFFGKLNWIRENHGHIEQIVTKYPGLYTLVVQWD